MIEGAFHNVRREARPPRLDAFFSWPPLACACSSPAVALIADRHRRPVSRERASSAPPTPRPRTIRPSRRCPGPAGHASAPTGATGSGSFTRDSSARKSRRSSRPAPAPSTSTAPMSAPSAVRAGGQRAGAAVPVPLDRPPLQGPRRADRRGDPGELEPHGFIGLTFYDSGARSIYNARAAGASLEDLRGCASGSSSRN